METTLEERIEDHRTRCAEMRKTVKKAGITGDWDHEPDRIEWKHNGLDCLMVRQPNMLHWCGYVAVRNGHPAFQKHYDKVDVKVHGGLTFADECSGPICHKSEGDDDKVWWLGFDCAHFRDLSPVMQMHRSKSDWPVGIDGYDLYRNVRYVQAETNSLADQLHAMEEKHASL